MKVWLNIFWRPPVMDVDTDDDSHKLKIMKSALLSCLAAVLFAGLIRPAEAADTKIRVLIVDGFSNHDWQQTTALLRQILEPTGLFDVSVSTTPQRTNAAAWDAWRPKFSDYDVVIQTCNDINHGPKWPEPVKKDFEDFVRTGGGVYIFHSAENAFVGWKEYERMVGLCWRKADYGTAIRVNNDGSLVRVPPGEGSGTGHGKRGDVLVTRLGDDPIHVGMPRAWLSPDMEVYYYARGSAENITV
ncbi:MAG TPA: ThuA domain-containing protein, partial [Candidatus Binatia bacterium]|nr:ThuA domain-containing protein [Candidatus Binatia bacterium]